MGSRDRQLIEERYGPLGGGAAELAIGGRAYGLREVLRLVGQDFETVRPVDLAACASEEDASGCGKESSCSSRVVWQKIKESIAHVLDSTTLADLCTDGKA